MSNFLKDTRVRRSLSDYHMRNITEQTILSKPRRSGNERLVLVVKAMPVFLTAWLLFAVIDFLLFRPGPFLDVAFAGLNSAQVFHRLMLCTTVSIIAILTMIRVETASAMDKALKLSSKWFSTTLKSVGVALLAVDKNGKIIFINKVAQVITGWKVDTAVGKRLTDVCNIIDAEKNERVVLEDQVSKVITDGLAYSYRTNLTLRSPDNQERNVVGNLTPIKDDNRNIIGAVFALHEVTDLVKAEAEILRLATAVEQAGEMVLISDLNGVIEYVNASFSRITGHEKEGVIGRNIKALTGLKLEDTVLLKLNEVKGSDEAVRERLSICTKSGESRVIESTTSQIINPQGNVVGYVSINRDVTLEAKLKNQLQQSKNMDAVGRMASGIAHDFKNILHAITGCNALVIKKHDDPEKVLKFSREIAGAVETARSVIEQLLTFSRKTKFTPATVDPREIVRNLEKILRRLVGRKGTLTIVAESDVMPVTVDPGQMNQTVINLVVNAVDAIDEGGTIVVRMENAQLDRRVSEQGWRIEPGLYVLISVTDSGRGIDDATLPHIFEPFFTHKDDENGTGLGLSVVYGFIKRVRGDIRVDSNVGRGTTFNLYLPATVSAADAIEQGENNIGSGTAPG